MSLFQLTGNIKYNQSLAQELDLLLLSHMITISFFISILVITKQIRVSMGSLFFYFSILFYLQRHAAENEREPER